MVRPRPTQLSCRLPTLPFRHLSHLPTVSFLAVDALRNDLSRTTALSKTPDGMLFSPPRRLQSLGSAHVVPVSLELLLSLTLVRFKGCRLSSRLPLQPRLHA